MALDMFSEISAMREEAAAKGIPTVIWSYPRGEALDKDGETAADISSYAAQIAALLGAHIIKVKLSTDHLSLAEAKKVYEDHNIDISTQAKRVVDVMNSALGGRRIVVFSGGSKKEQIVFMTMPVLLEMEGEMDQLLDEIVFNGVTLKPSKC